MRANGARSWGAGQWPACAQPHRQVCAISSQELPERPVGRRHTRNLQMRSIGPRSYGRQSIGAALAATEAQASGAQQRAWVSAAKGVDQAGCGPATSPCRSFQYAFTNAVAWGGTILVLDPGGYGRSSSPTRCRSSMMRRTGGHFQFNGRTNNAVDIALTDEGRVLLKGLTIDGGYTGWNGRVDDVRRRAGGGPLSGDQLPLARWQRRYRQRDLHPSAERHGPLPCRRQHGRLQPP